MTVDNEDSAFDDENVNFVAEIIYVQFFFSTWLIHSLSLSFALSRAEDDADDEF